MNRNDTNTDINFTNSLFSGLSAKRIWGYYILGVFIFYIWYQATVNVMYAGKLFAYSSFTDFLFGSVINFLLIGMLFLLNTLIVFGIKWHRNRLERLGLDFILSQAAPTLFNTLFIIVSLMIGKEPKIRWMQSFVLNFIILMINEMVFLVANYKHSQQKYEASQRLAIQLEYDVLRTQVNPHFLFNSLNILYSLLHLDVNKSQEFVLSLSRMYRYIMSRHDKAVESLTHEIEFLHSYVEVLKTLYFDCFEIEIINRPTDSDHLLLIPYSLQLLIENVTKHNAIGRDNPMHVTIKFDADGLSVSNPVRPRQDASSGSKSSGVGLNYLTKLYELHGGKVIVSADHDTFTVYLPFIHTLNPSES